MPSQDKSSVHEICRCHPPPVPHALKEQPNPIDPTALTPPHPLQLREDPSVTAAITTALKNNLSVAIKVLARTGLVASWTKTKSRTA